MLRAGPPDLLSKAGCRPWPARIFPRFIFFLRGSFAAAFRVWTAASTGIPEWRVQRNRRRQRTDADRVPPIRAVRFGAPCAPATAGRQWRAVTLRIRLRSPRGSCSCTPRACGAAERARLPRLADFLLILHRGASSPAARPSPPGLLRTPRSRSPALRRWRVLPRSPEWCPWNLHPDARHTSSKSSRSSRPQVCRSPPRCSG